MHRTTASPFKGTIHQIKIHVFASTFKGKVHQIKIHVFTLTLIAYYPPRLHEFCVCLISHIIELDGIIVMLKKPKKHIFKILDEGNLFFLYHHEVGSVRLLMSKMLANSLKYLSS